MICCKEATPRIRMEIRKNTMETQKEFHGVQITCEMPVFFKGVEASYFVEKDCLCRTGQEYMERIRLLADQSRNGLLSFKVGRNNLSEFYYMVLPRLRDVVDVTEADTEEIHEYLRPRYSLCSIWMPEITIAAAGCMQNMENAKCRYLTC